jgi:hypothetical protein
MGDHAPVTDPVVSLSRLCTCEIKTTLRGVYSMGGVVVRFERRVASLAVITKLVELW